MTETPTTTSPITRKVVLTVPRKYDLEIHVSKAKIDDAEYVDIREFVVSLQQYGRGIVLPKAALYPIIEALEHIEAEDRLWSDEEPTDG